MPLDQAYIELNRASRERIHALAERLSDEELQTKVGEHWTVGIVFAHLAFWDRRILYVLDMTEKNGKLFTHLTHFYAPAGSVTLRLTRRAVEHANTAVTDRL